MLDMKNNKCIFIGGKQIGANCLKHLLKRGIRPELVIGNLNDNGEDKAWHSSLVKISKQERLNTIKNTRINTPQIIEKIRSINPAIIFCIGGTQIIPGEILKIPKLGSLNIHPAFLPKYRGRYSIPHAIFNGEKYIGITVHWMDEGIDSGPIIMQKKIKIRDSDTAKTLYNKFTLSGERLFIKFLDMWLSGRRIQSVPQDENQASYTFKSLPNKGVIDWLWSGEKIMRFIRAMTFEPFAPVSFSIGDKEMVIIDKKYFKGFAVFSDIPDD